MIHAVRCAAAFLMLALLPATAMAATPAHKADWTRTFSVTPDGGFRMGNPAAKIGIVEYGSLICPHCRHFAQTAVKPLVAQYVRPGKASYEFRPFVLSGTDLAAGLVARCNGPSHFFPMAETLYATQPSWLGKLDALPKSERDRLDALPQQQLLLELARLTGLFPVAAAHGIPVARAQACLKDEKAALGLIKIEQAGNALGVHGTPTFFVNGKQVPAYDWDTLQPFLKESGG